jgi:hypothetical protein
MGALQKIKIVLLYWTSSPTTEYIVKGNEISILRRHLYSQVYCDTIHNNQDTEST